LTVRPNWPASWSTSVPVVTPPVFEIDDVSVARTERYHLARVDIEQAISGDVDIAGVGQPVPEFARVVTIFSAAPT
jgi:hypothetical protein